MTATQAAQNWRELGWQRDREHQEHGGCVAEELIKFPIEFLPDGKWHVGDSVLDARPLDLVNDEAGPQVLCGWTNECGEVATRAAAVEPPTGPELAVMLLRAFAQRDEAWSYWTDPTLQRLRGMLDLARAMPDSLLTRQVRALFGDLDEGEAWEPAPVPLSQLAAKRALTTRELKPRESDDLGTLTPGRMTPGMWVMVPDSSDPYGGRKIPREVAETYSEEQGDSVGRWVIRFAGEYLHPARLITAVDHEYEVSTPGITDRSALAVRYLAADGTNITDQPAPWLAAAHIHISERSGEPLAMLDLDPVFEFQRVWRLVPGFADVPAHWYAQRWTNAEPATHWVWDEIQNLTS